jgi:hypothetical protein
MRGAPSLADDTLAQILSLLPTQLLTSEEVKAHILDLGARYHRYLHQDEFGPTRAERISALRTVLGRLEQLDSQLIELPQHLALDLTSNSELQSWRILHCWSILRGRTVEQIHHAATLEFSECYAQRLVDDLNTLKTICAAVEVAIDLIARLDTSSEGELFVDSTRTSLLIAKNTRGIDIFCVEAAPLDHLKRQFRLTIDRLQHRHGPEKHLSLPWLVWQLCDLWTDVTGQSVTNSAFHKGRYTSCPESPAGRFVLAIVEALQPSEQWITQHLRPDAAVRARKFAASTEERARTVGIAMRNYVADHQQPRVRPRGRPRGW